MRSSLNTLHHGWDIRAPLLTLVRGQSRLGNMAPTCPHIEEEETRALPCSHSCEPCSLKSDAGQFPSPSDYFVSLAETFVVRTWSPCLSKDCFSFPGAGGEEALKSWAHPQVYLNPLAHSSYKRLSIYGT